MNTEFSEVQSLYASGDTQLGTVHGLIASFGVRSDLILTSRGVNRFPGAHYDGLGLNRHPFGVGVVRRGLPQSVTVVGVLGVTLTELSGQGQVFTNLFINGKLQKGHDLEGILCPLVALAVVLIKGGRLSVAVLDEPHLAHNLDSFLGAGRVASGLHLPMSPYSDREYANDATQPQPRTRAKST